MGYHGANCVLTNELKRANGVLVNMEQMEVADRDHITTLTHMITDFKKCFDMLENKWTRQSTSPK